MRPETDVGLMIRRKLPLAIALAAGTMIASSALAQSEYYEDADDRKDRDAETRYERYETRPVTTRSQQPVRQRSDADVEAWFDDDRSYVEYRTDEWDLDRDAGVIVYDQYYTVDYEREPFGTDTYEARFQDTQDRVRPGADSTVAEDTDYYYDPDRDDEWDSERLRTQPRQRERARIHEPPVQTEMQRQQQQQQAMGITSVSGELDSYREIHLQGQPEPHTIVKIRTDDGRIRLVNLGPRVSLRNMGLQQGDQVVAEGRRATINNHPALIATSIRAEGQSRQLQTSNMDDELWLQQRGAERDFQRQQRMRQGQDRQDWMQSRDNQRRQYQTTRDRQMTAAAAGTTTVRGELQSFGEIELRGQSQPHNIAEIRLQDGQRALVNFGPHTSPEDLNLQPGDQVMIEGRRGRINKQPVLMATSVEANGRRTQIRQSQAMGMQQQDQQQANIQGQDEELREQDESGYMYTTERVAQTGESGGQQQLEQIIISWPSASKEAARQMQSKYGEPDVKTSQMLIWEDSGPFVKTIVHKEPVQHDFPKQHEDVLEQCVKYQVPADKMDELAEFDGSIIVYRTEGTMSARCHKEPMNILALNLADQIVKGDLSVDEARQQLADTAKRVEQGEQPEMTRQLQFNTGGNTAEPDSSADESDAPFRPSSSPAGES